ncbi:PIN-like domain-containing protein [Bordetella genomosp. 6]|uniref:PIN-like domain-containing protein n=1 Tax=Bordetella genomosp. 6 TaxID=463024 RepID=UPI0012FC63E2|nr:PIN-like domain-containing protein [Bordetella genomosp. 6]
MKKTFSSHFRLTDEEFKALWGECLFAVDANVILHLYRYSPNTRQALERSLESIADQLFLPHQAAREFFNHRLNVTAGQAEEYTKAITKLKEITAILTDTRKHPFLAGEELQSLSELSPKLISQLEFQRDELLARLSNDEILDFVANVFNEKVGNSLSTGDLDLIIKEGDSRYEREIPPGYKDGKKQSTVDPYRKFGDLIIWHQLIQKSKISSRPIIFITDDRKEDWWLEQSGRTIGPRPELIEEFANETSRKFWMYTVDKFMEQVAAADNTEVNKDAIAEIIQISEESKVDSPTSHNTTINTPNHLVISETQLIIELSEFLESHPSEDGSVGLRYFVVNYLGSQNYEINHSYARLNKLADNGAVEIFQHQRSDGSKSTKIRLPEKR